MNKRIGKFFLSPLPLGGRAVCEITLLSGGSSQSEGRSPMPSPLLADARLSQRESEGNHCEPTTCKQYDLLAGEATKQRDATSQLRKDAVP